MPIDQSMMRELQQEYGKKKGRNVYFALEAKKKRKKKRNALA
jgi:hypothetical protein